MSTMVKRRRKFTKEFKEQAVRHLLQSDKTLKQVASELGVDRSVLGTWRRAFLEEADRDAIKTGNMKPSEMDREIRRLRKELNDVKEQRDILKKAVRIFSQDPNRYSDL